MQTEKVSVVMCTYNGAAYLPQQLDTILAQTCPIYEFLIFDDASVDHTWQVLKEYAFRYPVIKLNRNKKNLGYAANFRQALLAAEGDILAIADQDDIWVENKIEKMIALWKKPSLLIHCNSLRFAGVLPQNIVSNPSYRRFEGKDARKIFMFNTINGHAMLIRRKLLELALPYPNTIFYDWWFAVVAAYNGGVDYLNEILVFQRVHSQNVSIGQGFDHTQKKQRNAYKSMVINHLQHFISAPNISHEHKKFAQQFESLIKKSIANKLHLPLLFFMLRYSRTLFFHRSKKQISYIKYAFRLTYNYSR